MLIDPEDQLLTVWAEARCCPDGASESQMKDGHQCDVHIGVAMADGVDPLAALEMLRKAAEMIGEKHGITVLAGPIDPAEMPRDNPFGINVRQGLMQR